MKKWSHFLASLALSLSFFSSINAGCCYTPCACSPSYVNDSGCGVIMGAEFLYNKTCLDEFSYAQVMTTETSSSEEIINTEYKTLCLDYEPGVRAWLGFVQEGYIGMMLGYTYLCGKGHDQVVGVDGETLVGSTIYHPYLNSLVSQFNEVEVQWDNYYHEGEIVFGSDISCGKGNHFKPFFGVAGIYLEQKFDLNLTDEEVIYDGDIGTVDWKSEYWGVGLRFGSHYQYQFDQCFGFFGKVDASLLVGENKESNTQTAIIATESDFESTIDFTKKDKCLFVPGFSVGAGFSMTPDICGCGSSGSFSLFVGYEFNVWYNIPNHRTFTLIPQDDDDLEAVAYSDSGTNRTWGNHGLFAGMQISF